MCNAVVGINIMYAAFLVGYVVKAVALVGIHLNLLNNFSVIRFVIFFVIAFGLEAAGTLLALQLTNVNRRAKVNFAVTMNARGGPGIVLAILTTMLSSLIAGYWLRRQQKKDDEVFMNLTK